MSIAFGRQSYEQWMQIVVCTKAQHELLLHAALPKATTSAELNTSLFRAFVSQSAN